MPIREIQPSFPGSASRPSLQQISAEGPSCSIGAGRPMLRNPVPPLSRSKRGAGVVDQPIFHVEWEESGTETARPSDRIRRLSHGPHADRGTMVQAEMSPHQLSGTAGSKYCCKRQKNTAATGQPDSSVLCKQSGWDSLRPGHSNGEGALDVVLTEGYPTYCTTPTRSGKREGRHRVESDEGPLRLDVEPLGLSREYLPYLDVNLFATRLTYQLPHFYSWRPGPLAEVTVAFLQDWRRVKGYANPPWNLVGRVLS